MSWSADEPSNDLAEYQNISSSTCENNNDNDESTPPPSSNNNPTTWSFPRESYSNFSIHQTLLGKALYEHGDCKTVAAVAASSSSIQNSSLGPNLLSLIELNFHTAPLFSSVFFPDCGEFTNKNENSKTTLQFTKTIKIHVDVDQIVFTPLLSSLVQNTRYFSVSLQELVIDTRSTESRLESYHKQFFGPEMDDLMCTAFLPSTRMTSLSSLTIHYGKPSTSVRNHKKYGTLYRIKNCFPNLTKLDLSYSNMLLDDDQLLNHIVGDDDEVFAHYSTPSRNDFPHLTYLNLSHLHSIDGEEGFDSVTNGFGECCKNLKTLVLKESRNISVNGIRTIVNKTAFGGKSLTKLDVSGCESLDNISFQYIAKGCENLRELVARNLEYSVYDKEVKFMFFGLRNLTSLDLHGCCNFTGEMFPQDDEGASNDNIFGQEEDEDDESDLSPSSITQILEPHENLTSLNVAECRSISTNGLTEICRWFPRLKKLNMNECAQDGDSSIEAIVSASASSCHLLEDLTISFFMGSPPTKKKGLELIANRFTGLKRLTLNEMTSAFEKFDDDCISILALCCPSSEIISSSVTSLSSRLTHLSLERCEGVTNQGFKILCNNFPNLTHLFLGSVYGVDDEGFEQLGTSCFVNNLTSLWLGNWSKLTDEGIKNCLFGDVVAIENDATSEHSRYYQDPESSFENSTIRRFTNLKHLSLSSCESLTGAGFSCFFSSFSTSLLSLTELNLLWCPKISDVGLQSIASSCFSKSLRVLNLHSSREVTLDGLMEFVTPKNFPSLKMLEINRCDKKATDQERGKCKLDLIKRYPELRFGFSEHFLAQ